jgi:membrane associated rhomboid family serine protease
MLIPIRDLNPYKKFPIWTILLIAVNAVVFFTVARGLSITDQVAYHYGAVPCDVLHRCATFSQELQQEFPDRSSLMSVLTSMFMHADILHLGFNMLFLWVFGNNVEDRLGRIRYPIFYFVCGIAASYAHIFFNTTSTIPSIGASGAISGVLGAYFVLWPGATIVSLVPLGFFFFSVRTPAWVSLGLWFLLQLLGSGVGVGQTQGGGVAYLAHIGGFVTGMALIIPFGGRRKETGFVEHDVRPPP